MYERKKIGKVFTSKFVGTGPSSSEKIIYRAAVSQRLRNTGLYASTIRVPLPPSDNTSVLIYSASPPSNCSTFYVNVMYSYPLIRI
jgi:hypothetical protein